VLKGGLEIVESRDSGTIVSSGGWQYVAGSAIATTVNSGGEQEVVGGGITSGLTIGSGGLQYLAGFAVSTTIDGGTQIVTGNGRSIGYASGTLVENGGSQVVSNEAVANLTFVGSGGNLYVDSAGVAGATTLSGGTEYVSSGGNAFTTTIDSGGMQIVSSGGFAGEEGPGAIQGSTTILAGGVQQISRGGFASNTTINGGTQYVSGGGTARGTTVNSGGTQYVQSGGVAIDTTVNDDGTEYIMPGGTSSNSILDDPGYEFAGSGATIINPTINGGELEIQADPIILGPGITFSGTVGSLVIDGRPQVIYPIIGFAGIEYIDFASLPNMTLAAPAAIPGLVDLYSGKTNVATLLFKGGADPKSLEPSSANIGQTLVQIDSTTSATLIDPQPTSGGSIDWRVIHNNESVPPGYDIRTPYVPLAGTSGVTVGYGVDLGNMGTKANIQALFTSLFPTYYFNPNLTFLYNSIGIKYPASPTYLSTHGATARTGGDLVSTSVTITQAQANMLTTAAEKQQLTVLTNQWNAKKTGISFGSLPSQAQTALTNVTFNYGVLPNSVLNATVNAVATFSKTNPVGTAAAWSAVADAIAHLQSNHPRMVRDANLIRQIIGGVTYANPTFESALTLIADASNYAFSVTDPFSQYAFDPGGSSNYFLYASGNSASFSSIELPTDSAESYSVSYEIGSSWSVPQIAQPDQTINLPGGVSGLQVELLDSGGNPVSGANAFTFYVTFASAGSFSGDVYAPGDQIVSAGAIANVVSGETDERDLILGGAVLNVLSGGSSFDTSIGNGGVENVEAGGTDSGGVLGSGGVQNLEQDGIVLGIIFAGGTQNVLSGGTALAETIVSGIENIESGGLDLYGNVGPGGTQYLLSGGTASGTLVSGGGRQVIFPGGTAVDTELDSGSELDVFGSVSGFTISSGVTLGIGSGGSAINTTVLSGGTIELFGGATAIGSIISAGGIFEVGSGSTLSGRTVSSGSIVEVGSSGFVSNTAVSSGGTLLVLSGGLADPTTVFNGGREIISSGGTDLDARISGGEQDVFGLASGGTVFAGLQVVGSRGTASNTVVASGGKEIVSGGSAAGATVQSGGSAIAVAGGAIGSSLVLDGGVEIVSAGGTARNAVVRSGGIQNVLAGGTAADTTISGGRIEFAPGGVASGAVIFAGSGGTLKIDGAVMPTVVVSGFVKGDTLDLAAVHFDSAGAVQVVSGHVLQVIESSITYNLQLDPSQSNGSIPFRLTSDGSGGTDVIIAGPALGNVAAAIATRIGVARALSRNATVTDQDSSTLVGATIGVTSGTFAGDNDVLAASTSGTGITASYDSATEMLTLAGTDTLGHYQSVFESVTFATTSAGANPTRTITRVVNDGNPAFNLSPPVRTTVSIFTVNSAPVVMPSNSSIVSGHSNAVAASSLFTASDADGDPPTQYDFWDSGSAGGHWLLNGTALPNGQDNFISASQLSQVTYQGGAGTETLWLRASDGLVYGAWAAITATDTAPVLTVNNSNITVGHSNPVAASTLFTASDQDGDSIVQYDFWDSGSGGGHWLLNGNALPNGQDNFVPASQLSLVTYRGGAGTETLWERASDGIQYGAWVSLNATGTESAPVVAPTSTSVVASYKSSVAATTLFTVYDQDGDAITQYDFWDNGMGGGHWSINGVAQGSSVEIIVNASQLSQVTYTPGAGTDTLFVRANDGLLWSAWTMGFSATDTAPVSTPVHNLVGGAGTGKTYAVSDLFAVSDADGDAPTQYDFWDNGAGGGHWFIGNATQGSNQEILVNASQLSQVTYHAGTGSGTDTIYMRATDGLHFGAWTSGVAVLNAPVANPNQSAFILSHTQSVAASTLFTATDADNDAIAQYDFWDNGMGGGHWSINGTPQGSNMEIVVNASQLSLVTYTPGAGTDTLYMRVSDGRTGFGPWTGGFTATDAAPVSTWYTTSLVAGTGQTLAASNLFTASDADGDSITQYDFWDTGAGGGHWFIGNAAQGSNQEILVNASQLSLVSYHAGMGSDTLYVRANDGLQWGAWTPFTASGGTQPSSVTVPAGGGVEIATAASSTSASFASNTGTLKLDDSQHYTGTVAGLVGQDSLDLADINFINGTTTATLMNATSAGGTLQVTDGTHSANIALLGNYLASTFVPSSDGHGGTNIVDPPADLTVAALSQPQHA
jgi:autotransporter passenger strand-loop-strand repeat protein